MTLNVVAIDGPVGSGKSTVARSLAASLNWSYLDTGAMYRAVTIAARRRGLDLASDDAVGSLAETISIETIPRVCVDGLDVEDELRTPETNEGVSIVATLPRVRDAMVREQRAFALRQVNGTVVEGRDISTVVFPDARLKLFLTASLEERTRRRGDEDAASVLRRDTVDSERAISPLRRADDAMVLDTTGLSVDEVVKEIVACLKIQP